MRLYIVMDFLQILVQLHLQTVIVDNELVDVRLNLLHLVYR